MAASEDGSGCLVSRGRSQSDPSVLTDSSAASSADAGENPGNGAGRGRPGRWADRGQVALGSSPALLRAALRNRGAAPGPGRPASAVRVPRNAAGAPRSPLSGKEPSSRAERGAPHRPSLRACGLRRSAPRGCPALGADRPGEESPTCGRLRQGWLRALRPSPGPPAPAAPAWAAPPRQGSAPAAAAHGGSGWTPNSGGAWRTWARPPASRDRCTGRSRGQGDAGRAPCAGAEPRFIKLHGLCPLPRPRGGVDCLGDKSGYKGVYRA